MKGLLPSLGVQSKQLHYKAEIVSDRFRRYESVDVTSDYQFQTSQDLLTAYTALKTKTRVLYGNTSF